MLIIGVGNSLRRDDGVGPFVASRVQALLPHVLSALESGEGARLMELWEGLDEVILVDAVQAAGEPGEVTRLDVTHEPAPLGLFHYSTHAFSVAEAIETSRAISTLPERMIVYGIEGQDFGSGEGLTLPVLEAAEQVVKRIVAEAGGAGE